MADKEKPLKTALVRETETPTSRKEVVSMHRKARAMRLPGEQLSDFQKDTKKFFRMQSAAETGEAQAFVGQMKPGVELRTIKHSAHAWADGMEIRRDIEMERPGPVRPGDNWGHTRKYVPDVSFEGSGTETGSTKAQGLKHRAMTRALRDRRSAMRGDPQKANAVQALSTEEKSAVDAAAKAEVERVRAQAKASKEATVKARTITDDELFAGQSKEPIGKGRKDLGRSVTRTIRGGAKGDTELLRIAQRRSIAGRSIAGPDPAKPPTMAQRAKAARVRAGGIGGKIGMLGAIRGAFEGADTLKKLKAGTHDLTPEGTAVLKKGYTES